MIHRLSTFIEACRMLTGEQIGDLFSDNVTQEFRDDILEKYSTVTDPCGEHTRSAMQHLGELFNVQSLKDY